MIESIKLDLDGYLEAGSNVHNDGLSTKWTMPFVAYMEDNGANVVDILNTGMSIFIRSFVVATAHHQPNLVDHCLEQLFAGFHEGIMYDHEIAHKKYLKDNG